jgi:hypothetical protein
MRRSCLVRVAFVVIAGAGCSPAAVVEGAADDGGAPAIDRDASSSPPDAAAACVYPRPAPTDCGPYAAACAGAIPLANGGTDVAGAFAVDDRYLYWAIDREAHSDGCDPAILRADKHGGPSTPVVENVHAHLIAVDATHLYWLDDDGVGSAPKAGGPPETLVPHPDRPIEGYDGIAAGGGFVYWSVWSYGMGRTFWRVPSTGGAATLLYVDPSGASMTRFAIDGGYLYWAGEDRGWDGALHRVPVGGGAIETVVPGGALGSGAVGAGGGRVYFVAGDRMTVGAARPVMSLESAPEAGGTTATIAPAAGNYLDEVALDGGDVFWDEENGDSLAPLAAIHVAPGGGAPTVLWSAPSPAVSALAVDAEAVYFYIPVGPPGNEIVGFRGGIIARVPR